MVLDGKSKGSNLFLAATELESMMVSINCQLYGISGHLGDKSLGKPEKKFLDWINWPN